jgi:hypothetical protein
MTQDRTLDYRIGGPLDPRNKQFRVIAAPTDLLSRSRYWVPGPVLDQGREGACVGFGCTAEAMASPVRRRFYFADPGSELAPADPNEVARELYRRAQQIDEWEETREGGTEGTSVLAGMKVGQERGWWSGYAWALNMGELRAALEEGPVVIGVEWRSGMYDTNRYGVVIPSGEVVGGHCLLVTGYSAIRDLYRWRNSWGKGYGINGNGWIMPYDLNRILFQAGGEAAVPTGRQA